MRAKAALSVLLCSSLVMSSPLVQAVEDSAHEPIPQQTLLDYLAGKTDFTLIDARSADEYAAGHIWGAKSVPVESDVAANAELPADLDAAVVVYCKSGKRAEALQQKMVAMGYSNVRVLAPAQMLWADELPVFNCGATGAASSGNTLQTVAPAAPGAKS